MEKKSNLSEEINRIDIVCIIDVISLEDRLRIFISTEFIERESEYFQIRKIIRTFIIDFLREDRARAILSLFIELCGEEKIAILVVFTDFLISFHRVLQSENPLDGSCVRLERYDAVMNPCVARIDHRIILRHLWCTEDPSELQDTIRDFSIKKE